MSRYKILLGETKPELPKIETFGFEKNIKNYINFLNLNASETGLFSLIPGNRINSSGKKVTHVKQMVHWSHVLKKYVICDPSGCCCSYPFKEGSISKSKERVAYCVFCKDSITLERGLYTWLFIDSVIDFYLENKNSHSFYITRNRYMKYEMTFSQRPSMFVTPDLQKMADHILNTVKLGIVLNNDELINIHGRE